MTGVKTQGVYPVYSDAVFPSVPSENVIVGGRPLALRSPTGTNRISAPYSQIRLLVRQCSDYPRVSDGLYLLMLDAFEMCIRRGTVCQVRTR